MASPLTFGGTPPFPADRAPRSYLMNGWDDYLNQTLPPPWDIYARFIGMPETAIPHPSQTILFGEKKSFSGHFWMNAQTGDDYQELEQARHGARRAGPMGGGSNHTMVDGSVRMLLFGKALAPTNLWAVTDIWRTNSFSP